MMKSYTSFIVLIGLFVLLNNTQSYAQGLTCQTSTALCDDITPYPAGTTGAVAPAGNNYDCLLSQPDPVFFNITIGQSGTIQFDLENTAAVDVDFILWGPFTDLLAAEAACGNMGNGGAGGNVIDCSYDPQAFESVDIANAQSGEVYIMMVTNYSNAPTGIFSTPNTGTGTIVCPCDIAPTFSETPIASNKGVMVDSSGNTAEFRVCPNDTLSFTISFGADQIVDSLGINTGAITIGNAFSASQYNIYGPFYTNAPLFDSMEYIVEIFTTDSDVGIHQFNLSTINFGPGSTCFDSYPITVIVPGIADIPERDTICSGQDYQVIADVFAATNGGTSTYLWSQISGPAATINPNNTIFNPTFSPTAAAAGDSMSFELAYTYGTCTQVDTIELFFFDIDINISAAPNPVCAGDPSNLQAILTDTIGETTTVVCDAYNGVLVPYAPIAGVGTLPAFSDLDEGITAVLPIGFNFNFYCNNYSQFYIHANGYITFTNYTGNTSYLNQFIPDPTTPNNLIAGGWTDLDLSKGGSVDYFTTGTTPNQRLVVNFNNVATYNNTDVTSFQIVVHESTNIVEIHATDVNRNSTGTLTMGMENDLGTLAISPGVNQLANSLLPNQTIRFTPVTTTGSASITYAWTPTNTLNDPTIFNPIASPTAPTTYIVDITNGACTFTDSIMVDITGSLPAPTVTCGTTTQTSIQFDWTALALPAGGFYEYSTDGGMTWTNAGTSLSATLNSLSPNQTVNILVRGNDNLGTNCSPGAQGPASCTTLPCAITAILDSVHAVKCFGGSDGAVEITVSGGPPTVTYLWSNGATTEDISGLMIGDYTVTITDGVGCTITSGPHNVAQPTKNASVAIDSTTDASCNGMADGAIHATTSGGTPTYTYIWSNGATTEDVSGIADGTYTLTVSDANGCSTTEMATVSVPDPIVINLNPIDPLCNGDATGCIGTTITGGNGAFGYNWSNGATLDSICGLAAGTYYLTITDTASTGGSVVCTAVDSVVINEPLVLNITLDNIDSVSCNGGNDGLVDITANGGTGTLTYNWSNGQTNQDATGLIAGNYTVTVLDANGCSMTSGPHTVEEPAAINIMLDSITNASCNAANDGGVYISATGGTGTLTYLWSDGQTIQDATGLIAGNYSVTVLDANGCSMTSGPHTVMEPTSLVVMIDSIDDASCSGMTDGAIYASVTGGTLNYTYLWSNGETTEDVTGLTNGTYTLTVTDANGCMSTEDTTISVPAPISLTFNPIDPLCNGGTGCIGTTVSGGNGNFGYNWSNGAMLDSICGLTAGNYYLTVTDTSGTSGSAVVCSVVDSVVINEPSAINITLDSTDNISCNAASDGVLYITATGGTGTLTYLWSDGQTIQDATGLIAGNYSVTVLDANGCSITSGPHPVTEPTVVNIILDSTDNISCNGANDGVLYITATGGTGTLTYLWSDGQTIQDATGLIAGNYSVTVLDANGCSMTSGPHPITEPTVVNIILDSTDNISCNGANDGVLYITATGGTGALTYLWSDGQTIQDATGLIAGNYSVTVLDANSCSMISGPHTITEPTALAIIQDSTTAPSCNGTSDGAIYISATGGTTTYTFEWSTGATTEDLVGIASGSYTVTLTDANNCEQTFTTSINQPGAVSLSLDAASNVDCAGSGNGTISITATGGNPAYSFIWSNGATDEDLTGLAGGIYTCTVSDQNNCTDTLSAIITEPTTLSVSLDSTHNVSCGGSNDGAAFISVSGGTGAYTFAWNNSSTTEDITGLAVGTYVVTVSDQNNCTDTLSATVGSASGITISDNTSNATCVGNADGTINLTVNGGTPGYTYLWNNNATTQNVSGLSAGTYAVTVTDNVGCAIPYTATAITAPSAVTVSLVSSSDPTCAAGNDGSIDISATGGTTSYTFAWSNGDTSQNITNLVGGTYTVTATDANGCVGTNSISLNTAAGFTLGINTITGILACDLGSIGELQAIPTPADTSITYIWSNGDTTATISGLAVGIYTVTASSSTGCTATSSDSIIAPVVPSVNAFVNNAGTTDTTVNWNDELMLHSGNDQSAQGVTYTWTFTGPTVGDMGINTPNLPHTTALPTEDGLYNIVLTATATTNAVVCTDQDSLKVTVKAKFQGVPTAFTPNGDNQNELFRPIGLDASDIIEFKVYNRWGQVVYNGDDLPNNGWDGTFNNVDQPRDVYIYILRFKQTGDNEETKMRGNVTLIR